MIAKALSDEQVEKIHVASLSVLEKTGVEIPHPEVLSRFKAAGAKVDEAKNRVRIPPALVMRLLSKTGKQFAIFGRDPKHKARFGFGERNYNGIAGEAMMVDEIGQQRRFPKLEDVANAARVGDALKNITIPGAMADPHELPVEWRCVQVAATMLKNTTKPLYFWYHDRGCAKFLNELMIAVRGSEKAAAEQPLFMPFLEPISPLRFPFNGVDFLFETARLNLPVPIGPMAQTGLSAPGTLAGTMAVENAEILAGVCITQLVREGMPVCYGGICHAFDMRTTQMIFCGPEQAIFGVAMTQMGKRYGLPVYINVGLTDSKRPDGQAGLEASTSLVLGAAAGADIFGHMGISGVDQAGSLDMLVFQEEVISFVESVMRALEIDDETLGLNEIDETGPGGTFIDREHTVEHFRKELWVPRLLDRDFYTAWIEKGALSTEDRVRSRKQEILKKHAPEPVPAALEKAIDGVVAAAKKELGK